MISLRVALLASVSRKARAVAMHDRTAADSEPAMSARKNATTPSPTWRPTNSSGIDDLLVGGTDETADEREVLRCRQGTSER